MYSARAVATTTTSRIFPAPLFRTVHNTLCPKRRDSERVERSGREMRDRVLRRITA